jgi:hypothetical protein
MTKLEDISLFFKCKKEYYLSQDHIPWPIQQNEVRTTTFSTTIPLTTLTREAPGSLRQNKLSVGTFRFHEQPGLLRSGRRAHAPRCPTVQWFSKGKGVWLGTTSEEKTRLYNHILRFMQLNMGLQATSSRMLLRNRVSSAHYPYRLDIKNFEYDKSISAVIDDGSFPGTIFVFKPPGCPRELRFSLFESGSFIVMGMNGDNACEAFLYVLPILHKNRAEGGKNKRNSASDGVTAIQKEMRKRNYSEVSSVREDIGSMVRRTLTEVDLDKKKKARQR